MTAVSHIELAAIPLPCGRPLFRLPSSRAMASALARHHSRILAQHRFAPPGAGALTSVFLPDSLDGVKPIRSFLGNPGSVGALSERTFNSNPSRTHRDAKPRLTNSEAL
jgi:hypothetical protein